MNEASFKDLIYQDDLTGVFNRRALREILGQELSKPEGEKKGLYLVLTDVDNFKNINDTYGHLNGDFILVEYCKILINALQNENYTLTRYGGDEFVILLKGTTQERVSEVCENIRAQIATTKFQPPEDQQVLHITVSMGISEYPTDGIDSAQLFKKADEALYTAKLSGKNRVSLAKDIVSQIQEEKRVQDTLSHPPFIGREKELNEIENYLFAKRHSKLVLLRGAIGVGKTRTLNQSTELLKSKDTECFYFQCSETDVKRPYSLILNIINSITEKYEDLSKEAFENLEKNNREAISLLPGLKKFASPQENITQSSTEIKINLFYALGEFLSFIIERITPVFLIDEIAWVDQASTELLTYIITSRKQTPLRICATLTQQENGEAQKQVSHLNMWLDRISEFEIIPSINLPPLSEAETKKFIFSIFPEQSVPPDFTNIMYQKTGGNIFFMKEILRDFLERGIISLKYPQWHFNASSEEFPQDLRELLSKKLATLTHEEKELLMAAAGIGGSFRFDFLSKLRKVNTGYLQDIMNKAAMKDIFPDRDILPGGTISFRNQMIRKVLYESISKDTKKELHLDIAKTLEEEFKDDIESVSLQLAFHFTEAELESKAEEYLLSAQQYVDKLFSNKEIVKALEVAIQERLERDKYEPLEEESWPIVLDIISAVNSAIKSQQIYQVSHKITSAWITRLHSYLQKLFEFQDNITISNPEGYKLLINGFEFPNISPSFELESKNAAKSLIMFLSEFSVGSLTFRRRVTKTEIESFITILGSPKMFHDEGKQWKQILLNREILGIQIDQVVYKRVLSEEERKNYQRDILKNIVAQGITLEGVTAAPGTTAESTEAGGGAGGAGGEGVGLKFEGVTKEEKNILAKTIAQLPINVIADTICNEYSKRQSDIIDIKEMISVILENVQQKQELIPLLKSRLEKLGISKESFEWLIDSTPFLEKPVQKRSSIYMNTDAKTLLEMGVLENLKPTLEQLFAEHEDKVALAIIEKYMQNLQSETIARRAYVGITLEDILRIIPSHVIGDYLRQKLPQFFQQLQSEEELAVYELLLKTISFLIMNLMEMGDYQTVREIITFINDMKKLSEGSEDKQELANKAFVDIHQTFSALNIFEMLDDLEFDREKSILLLNLIKTLGAQSVPHLVDILAKRFSRHISMELYEQSFYIINILKEYKNTTITHIDQIFENAEVATRIALLDILENLPDVKLILLYKKYLVNESAHVREHIYRGLIKLNLPEIFGVLQERFMEEDTNMQLHIITTLDKSSTHKEALTFLENILKNKQAVKLKREINQARANIKRRIKRG